MEEVVLALAFGVNLYWMIWATSGLRLTLFDPLKSDVVIGVSGLLAAAHLFALLAILFRPVFSLVGFVLLFIALWIWLKEYRLDLWEDRVLWPLRFLVVVAPLLSLL